jgi:hypothetical protein
MNNQLPKEVDRLCPKLSAEDVRNLNFDFTDDFYNYFNDFIYSHPGKTTGELVESIDRYKFTPETLVLAFKLFNTYKCTYHNVCGPFIYKQERWFPVYNKKYTDNIILAEENSKLKSELEYLKLEIAKFKNLNPKI